LPENDASGQRDWPKSLNTQHWMKTSYVRECGEEQGATDPGIDEHRMHLHSLCVSISQPRFFSLRGESQVQTAQPVAERRTTTAELCSHPHFLADSIWARESVSKHDAGMDWN